MSHVRRQDRLESDSRIAPLVCAVTVNWNGLDDTIGCVESLQRQTYSNLSVIVVDNASTGDDVQRILERFGPTVDLVRNDANLGCGGGYNSGIHFALERYRPHFVLVVNNDVVTDDNMVAELVGVAQSDDRAGIVGPKIYYYNWQGRQDVIWSAGGRIRRWGLKIHSQRGDGEYDGPEFNVLQEVDWVSGAAALLTPAALRDAGYFNTWYFIGHEDVELCLKAAVSGHRILYAPKARAWHKVSASAKKMGISYADPAAYFYLIRNTFPRHVYLYHLALFPLLLGRWGLLYLMKSRDPSQLRRFLSDVRRMLAGGSAS